MSDPIEPLSDNERITIPAHLLHSNAYRGDHYVLRVVGDSMNEDCCGTYAENVEKIYPYAIPRR